ncbi:hypothetical protein M3J09_000636 [Ascochyta lentis]
MQRIWTAHGGTASMRDLLWPPTATARTTLTIANECQGFRHTADCQMRGMTRCPRT